MRKEMCRIIIRSTVSPKVSVCSKGDERRISGSERTIFKTYLWLKFENGEWINIDNRSSDYSGLFSFLNFVFK